MSASFFAFPLWGKVSAELTDEGTLKERMRVNVEEGDDYGSFTDFC